jgi:hypothetical protein
VFNVLFVEYSLAKNNLNNTYQYNMISKNFSKTMNYLIILIKFKVSRFLCRSMYLISGLYIFRYLTLLTCWAIYYKYATWKNKNFLFRNSNLSYSLLLKFFSKYVDFMLNNLRYVVYVNVRVKKVKCVEKWLLNAK